MTGHGFVQPGNAHLGIDVPEAGWHLELARLDGEAEPRFSALHKQEVRPQDLQSLVPQLGAVSFRQARTLPGMPESAEGETEVFRVVLTSKGELGWEHVVAGLRAWLGAGPGGRRLA